MRGTPDRAAHDLAESGIIPAHAGNTDDEESARILEEDHPRACGEHHRVMAHVVDLEGSSPRMRGTQSVLRI